MKAAPIAILWAALSAAEPSFIELNKAARAAHEAKNYAEFRADLMKLRELLPGSPRIVYNLACAEALLGNGAASVAWLRAYAGMGLAQDIGADRDLDNARGARGYNGVLRRMRENRRPVSHASAAFTLPESDLIAEDIAYDPRRRIFYISSVRKRKILSIDSAGRAADFVREGQDGIDAVLAVSVDSERGLLWATTAAMEEQREGYQAANADRSALLKYDLATGKLIGRFAAPRDGERHVLGDMTLNSAGDVFVTDSGTAALYTLRRGAERLQSMVAPGTFLSPQTPAVAPNGRLFVADYARGVAVVQPDTGAVAWLSHPENAALSGIDGLYLVGSSLIAVQNGTSPERVARFELDPALQRVTHWSVIQANTPGFGDPTHGVVAGANFYFIANSGWDRVGKSGEFKAGPAPAVMKTALFTKSKAP